MKKSKLLCYDRKDILYALLGLILLIAGAFISPINHYISAFVLLIGSVVLYFLFAVTLDSKNYLSLKAEMCIRDRPNGWLSDTIVIKLNILRGQSVENVA